MSFHTIFLGVLGAAVLWVFKLLSLELTSPLRNIPGPFASRISRLWLLNRIGKLQFHRENVVLHRKFGPIVRLAPNIYSIDDVEAIKQIYGFGTKFTKSDWYSAWHNPEPGSENLFSDQNVKRHMEKRKKFAFLYSKTSVRNYEPFVEHCNNLLCQHFREAALQGKAIDLSFWMKCYAFDVITAMIYGRRFGFLDRGEDVGGTMSEVDKIIRYSGLAGIVPEVHPWIFNIAARFPWSGVAGRKSIIRFVQGQVMARQESRQGVDAEKGNPNAPQDFMDRLLAQQDQQPIENVIHNAFELGLTSIMAGFDSTALTLSAVWYHLLRNPISLAKLRKEISQAMPEAEAREKKVSMQTSPEMPYLQAVIKEGMRVHPGASVPFFRTVPESGATLSGQFFPTGTVVGMSAWTVHFNRDVFGADADQFRPERWIEAEAEAQKGCREGLRRMDACYMAWGYGSRSCLGKHIALLEMYKLIPRLVTEFDFQLKEPIVEWDAGGHVWVKPESFFVSVQKL